LTQESIRVFQWNGADEHFVFEATTMPARHRPNPRTRETRFRVYRIAGEMRERMSRVRLDREQTVHEFVGESVARELPALVETLTKLGIAPTSADVRPVKLPLTEEILTRLKTASEATGLPKTTLLIGCLNLASSRAKRRNQ